MTVFLGDKPLFDFYAHETSSDGFELADLHGRVHALKILWTPRTTLNSLLACSNLSWFRSSERALTNEACV